MSPFRIRTRGHDGGYSLAEALVVLALISLLTTVSVPPFTRSLKVHRLREAARQILSDLRLTRAFAMSAQETYRLELNPDGTYRILNGLDLLPEPGWDRVRLPRIGSIEIDSPSGGIQFLSLGESDGGTIMLQGEATRKDGQPQEIRILAYRSGQVRLIEVLP